MDANGQKPSNLNPRSPQRRGDITSNVGKNKSKKPASSVDGVSPLLYKLSD
jgi:hypothetical protein